MLVAGDDDVERAAAREVAEENGEISFGLLRDRAEPRRDLGRWTVGVLNALPIKHVEPFALMIGGALATAFARTRMRP